MRPGRTQVYLLPSERLVTRAFRSGVSLHSHTEHSRERLGALPRYLERMPVVSQFMRWEIKRHRDRTGETPTFPCAIGAGRSPRARPTTSNAGRSKSWVSPPWCPSPTTTISMPACFCIRRLRRARYPFRSSGPYLTSNPTFTSACTIWTRRERFVSCGRWPNTRTRRAPKLSGRFWRNWPPTPPCSSC